MNTTDLERKVLGGLLLLGDEALPPWATHVTSECFTTRELGQVMIAVDDIIGAGEPIDLITVSHKLHSWGTPPLDSLIAELAWEVPTVANLNHWSKLLVEQSRIREMQTKVTDLAKRADGDSVDDIRAGLRDAIDTLRPALEERGLVSIQKILPQVLRNLDDDDSASTVTKTGLIDLDRELALHEGDLTIIAGRPAMGKTSLVGCIARNAARDITLGTIAIFSLEMSAVDLITRMVAAEVRAGGAELRAMVASGAVAEAANTLHQLDLWVDDRPGLGVDAMRVALGRLRNVQLVIVDYLQLTKLVGSERHDIRIGDVTKGLKAIAKQWRCHVITLSQLNRAVEKREPPRPRISDLRDSGNIEEDADNILLLYREHYYNKAADPTEAEVNIAKQRKGPTPKIMLHWDETCQQFRNSSKRAEAE